MRQKWMLILIMSFVFGAVAQAAFQVPSYTVDELVQLPPQRLIEEIQKQETLLAEMSAELEALKTDPNNISTDCESTYEFRNFGQYVSLMTAASTIGAATLLYGVAGAYDSKNMNDTKLSYVHKNEPQMRMQLQAEMDKKVRAFDLEATRKSTSHAQKMEKMDAFRKQLKAEMEGTMEAFRKNPAPGNAELAAQFAQAEKIQIKVNRFAKAASYTFWSTAIPLTAWATFKYLNSHEDHVRFTEVQMLEIQNSIYKGRKNLASLRKALELAELVRQAGGVQ